MKRMNSRISNSWPQHQGWRSYQHKTVAIHKPERACTARVNQATPGGLQYLLFYSSFQFVFNGRGRASTPRSDKIT